ncbi:MAG: sigma factor G inhibitor Gin [Candidatus Diapherotrites archaeon]|nr:sigma factor G inhibitor Gin [Candidatus Diapherotrites archaeon]
MSLTNQELENKINEWMRHGDIEKMQWAENIQKKLLASSIQRIKQNDKTVLREIVLPKWLDWDLLRALIDRKPVKDTTGRHCILCDMLYDNGIHFNEKFICESCFLKLKYLDVHKQADPMQLPSESEWIP